jgi:hypothetical protein
MNFEMSKISQITADPKHYRLNNLRVSTLGCTIKLKKSSTVEWRKAVLFIVDGKLSSFTLRDDNFGFIKQHGTLTFCESRSCSVTP